MLSMENIQNVPLRWSSGKNSGKSPEKSKQSSRFCLDCIKKLKVAAYPLCSICLILVEFLRLNLKISELEGSRRLRENVSCFLEGISGFLFPTRPHDFGPGLPGRLSLGSHRSHQLLRHSHVFHLVVDKV